MYRYLKSTKFKIDEFFEYCYHYTVDSEILDTKNLYKLNSILSSAGIFSEKSIGIYIFAHLIIPLLFIFLITCLSFFLNISTNVFLIMVFFLVILGLLLPTLFVFFLRRRARASLVDSAISALELMCICTEFGSSIDNIIKLISEIMRLVKKNSTSNLMDKLLADLERSSSRQEAWYKLQAKVPSEEFASMIRLISQSDLYGASMLVEQRKQLDSLRELRVEKLEKEASKTVFKVSMVLTVCLVPTFMILGLVYSGLSIKRSVFYHDVRGTTISAANETK